MMNENNNPFENGAAVPAGTVQVQSDRAKSEVQAQVIMARKFPRDPVLSYDRIMNECSRVKLAEQACYSYPRAGTTITGPSIRLAEALARNWGNISFGITEVERGGLESSVVAWAWDLETNTRRDVEFKVPHYRETKQERKKLTDDRDIYEMVANQGARRMRACILGIIPGDVIDAAVEKCQKTLRANIGDIKDVTKKLLEAFGSLGVTKEMIEKRLGRRIETIEAGEVVSLRAVYSSIVDHMGKVDDYFPPEKKPEDVIKTAKAGGV